MMQYVEVEQGEAEERLLVYLDEQIPEDTSLIDPGVKGYVFFQFHSEVSLFLAESALCEVITTKANTRILKPLGVYNSRTELTSTFQTPRLRFNLRVVPDDYRGKIMRDIQRDSFEETEVLNLYRWPIIEPWSRDMTHG